MHKRELLVSGIRELGLEISDRQTDQFFRYYEMLIETNKVMNLTSIVDPEEVIRKHFLDSLLVTKIVNMNGYQTMIDVGTGAGFPGIPIKIMFPNMKVTLLDSLNKRIKFLNDVISELKLTDIVTIHGRAEDIGKEKIYREKFDICVSRAVANLSTLAEYCIPFVSEGGKFISYKSAFSEEERNIAKKAVHVMGGKILSGETVQLPFSDIKRCFIMIDKIKKTPEKYPRKAGIPSKKPIK